MSLECESPVTHIGEKGYVYCREHAERRRGREQTRAMKPWEIAHIIAERPLLSYAPITKREDAERRARLKLAAS